jgi:hypothetical protein
LVLVAMPEQIQLGVLLAVILYLALSLLLEGVVLALVNQAAELLKAQAEMVVLVVEVAVHLAEQT